VVTDLPATSDTLHALLVFGAGMLVGCGLVRLLGFGRRRPTTEDLRAAAICLTAAAMVLWWVVIVR